MLCRVSKFKIGLTVNRRCFDVGATTVTTRGEQNSITRNHFSVSNEDNLALTDILSSDRVKAEDIGAAANFHIITRGIIRGDFSGISNFLFQNDAFKIIGFVVTSVPFLVGNGFVDQTERDETGNGTPSSHGMKSGSEQLEKTRTEPHDETNNQKVHVTKLAKLIGDVLPRNKFERNEKDDF